MLSPGPGSFGPSWHCTDRIIGTAVLEYGPAETLPPVGAQWKAWRVSADPVVKPAAQTRAESRVLNVRKQKRERDRLSAGGRWIRTLGPPARESSVVAPCTRRAVSLRGLVAHPTVEQHAQRGDEGERLV